MLLDLVKEFRRGDDIRRHGLQVRSKLLFCGPPGCGKTLCAEIFARELGLPLFVVKLDRLLSSYLGETVSDVRKIFDFACKQPCVLFFDEFDALARARDDSGEHNELRRVVNSLLSGALLRMMLTLEDIASIDQPSQTDMRTAEAYALALDDVPALNSIAEDAPVIGIIDSGINDHPFLADILVGAIGVPETLGSTDDWGHGTRVAGVVVLGNLRAQIAAGTLARGARLCSAKVVDAQGEFDDRRLVPAQMREAIGTLNARFGCRIFVISLGDRKRRYDGGKVGT